MAQFIDDNLQQRSPYGIRLIQGSHIVVPRLYEGEQAYIMQNEDRRIVFAIPYMGRYTMIGTTDREHHGDPAQARISEEEIAYLLGVANAHFRKQLEREDILHTFTGVRPLCDDESDNPSVITRDYTLFLSAEQHQAPLLSVFGGKLTTYRKLAEAALVQLAPFFPNMGGRWTRTAPLPGGEDLSNPDALAEELVAKIEGIDLALARRWASLYGSRVWRMLGEARAVNELGELIGQDLYTREVDYLRRQEWATRPDDILWRRTKLGLVFTDQETARLQHYLAMTKAKEQAA